MLLPGGDPLSRNSLQQPQLDIIVRRPDALDIAEPAAPGFQIFLGTVRSFTSPPVLGLA